MKKTHKHNFFTEKGFDKYINSLPKYYKKHKNKYDNYIKDFLLKNRSSRLADIVKGCHQQGLKFEAHYPSSIYKTLNNLIKSGYVTKKDKIYFWNYN